ncbi:MAG TPA: toxin TcdB middle/N-terminal domain-containing protein, partial [Gemmatimonadales bacterium]|nr:toxin TcdB middle/N-terminal domain-containing protein [Gemmatimonadales bacterium]
LMAHRFDELGAAPLVVSAYQLAHSPDLAGSTIVSITHTGYRTDPVTGDVEERARPPLTLRYGESAPEPAFEQSPEIDNAPVGLDGAGYRWADLLNEGLPGILAERDGAWYFKRNLGDGRFGPLTPAAELPNAFSPGFDLRDLDGDGALDLVGYEGREAGWYERDRVSGGWGGYRPLAAQPRVDLPNAGAQWVDLDGDGSAELVIDRGDRLVWYPSDREEGFGAARELAKLDAAGGGAPALAERAISGRFFADMNGDGLADLVVVGPGSVTYWPSLGHGRFGAAVTMEDPPALADFGEADPSRWRLLDLDGSGTADLLCLGDGEVFCWTNQAGNRFGPPRRLAGLPVIDGVSRADVLDFLGDGSHCLVWSTPLPGHETRALQHLVLTRGTPPRLLRSVSNSAGRSTELSYRFSARDYLRDAASARPWRTPLATHVMVVDRREMVDEIGGGRLVSRYEYHDGIYDPRGRRFVGFARTDTYDADLPHAGDPDAVPPVLVRRWYHTGAPPEDEAALLEDAWAGDPLAPRLRAPEIAGLAQLGTEEQLDAFGALAGLPRREELHRLDAGGNPIGPPLQVEQWGYRLRRIAPGLDERGACIALETAETLRHEYEEDPADPRVQHEIVLDSDPYGRPRRSASVAYPRRPGVAGADPRQAVLHVTATDSTALTVDTALRFEADIDVEEREHAIHGLAPPPAPGGLLDRDALQADVAAALAAPLGMLDPPPGAGQRRARLLRWRRQLYWNAGRTDALPLGQVGPVTLHHHGAQAYLPEADVAAVFGGRATDAMLAGDAKYRKADGYWWAEGEAGHYAGAEDFYRQRREELPSGDVQTVEFDPHRLFVAAVEDARGNRTEHATDYQALAAAVERDPNGNLTEARFEPLGSAAALAVRGEQHGEDGAAHPVGAEPLQAYSWRGATTVAAILADPPRFLQSASRFTWYDPGAWLRGEGPPCVVLLEGEAHPH